MTDDTLIKLEYRGSIAILRLNRPLVHNSLNEELIKIIGDQPRLF